MFEIKFLNFKEYNERLKFARPCTEHELFEITNLKFQFKIRT